MRTTEQKILNNYLGLLQGLTPEMKLSIIKKLKESSKKSVLATSRVEVAFG
jgi:hypothetical protein